MKLSIDNALDSINAIDEVLNNDLRRFLVEPARAVTKHAARQREISKIDETIVSALLIAREQFVLANRKSQRVCSVGATVKQAETDRVSTVVETMEDENGTLQVQTKDGVWCPSKLLVLICE